MSQLGARINTGQSLLNRGGIWPGLALALGLALCAQYLARVIGVDGLGFSRSPVSPILLAILGGLALRNLIALPNYLDDGIRFALNRLLKLGIILMGIRLSLVTIGDIGLEAIPVVIACILTALVVVNVVSRWLGLTPTLAALIAVGTSICGCTAIMAAAPVIRASRAEICYAVTCVALFGTVGMLAYPFLANWLFGDNPLAAGMLLGVGIHDTSQVVGAGLLYAQYFGSEAGLDAAVVTKLLRNLSIILVVPALGIIYARSAQRDDHERTSLHKTFPLFVVGFVLMSMLRTLGDSGDRAFGLMSQADWQFAVSGIQQISTLLLTIAMAAVGLSTNLRGIRGLGLQPAGVGLLAATVVGGAGILLISTLV